MEEKRTLSEWANIFLEEELTGKVLRWSERLEHDGYVVGASMSPDGVVSVQFISADSNHWVDFKHNREDRK